MVQIHPGPHMNDLSKKHCVPCEGNVPPLSPTDSDALLAELASRWCIHQNKLTADFTFSDFKKAMTFVNKIAEIAEQENHHPDIAVFYNRVTLTIYTHAIKGLSENDFILAAKIESYCQRL